MLDKQIRFEVRIKNNMLWHFIYDNYGSIAEYCQREGYSYPSVINIVNLKYFPKGKRGYHNVAMRMAAQIHITPEMLFPPELYGIEQTKAIIEVSLSQLPGLKETKMLPEHILFEKESKKLVHEALHILPPRERQVIEMRMEGEVFQDIADELGVTRSRAQQVEAKGMRRLREGPKTSKKLKAAYEMLH